ncbi:toxin-antitoxin system YwqK family antitoxin [Formosa sp. L2A11]|uniref:toxin-antitoxin system YwqK family antitoxin n=1 Tax=Formosa sp. L2A11 TaxID=2686363 RepID=UPI00131BE324|nr:hypothetical protein [Formosa sp. L2A11]
MKQIALVLITALYFFIGQYVYGQSKIYYDKYWDTTTQAEAHFYRTVSKNNDSLFSIKDYYINGVLQMDGVSSSKEEDVWIGKVNFYNKQGEIELTQNYTNGVLNGLTTAYLETGKIDYTADYKNGKVYNGVENGSVTRRYYKNGVVIKDVEYSAPNQYYILNTTIYGKDLDTIYWRTANGKELGSGTFRGPNCIDGLRVLNLLDNTVYMNYKNGLREGIQKLFDSKGRLIANMTYKNDKLIRDENFNPLTNKMVTCTYKDNIPFEGRYFEYKPMYKTYTEYVYKNGTLTHRNLYNVQEDDSLTLTDSITF